MLRNKELKLYKNKRQLIENLISKDAIVLDIGFLGQGIKKDDLNWPHALLKKQTKEVYGVDIDLNHEFKNNFHYQEANAEDFSFSVKFDIIFAGDIIEHLSNPGLFLDCCKKNLKPEGFLIITTPNAFNLFNIAGKLMNVEPVVNSDHTAYFNSKTIDALLKKNHWSVDTFGYIYTLDIEHKESIKKKILNVLYRLLSFFTSKFYETMVVVAKPIDNSKITH